MGTDRPNSAGTVTPKLPLDGRTSGSSPSGTPKSPRSSSLQASVSVSKSIVREALVGSVAWTRPPVRCHTSQLSTVPAASSPRSARARTPGSASSHSSFVAEK
jgi:hypothetical protein